MKNCHLVSLLFLLFFQHNTAPLVQYFILNFFLYLTIFYIFFLSFFLAHQFRYTTSLGLNKIMEKKRRKFNFFCVCVYFKTKNKKKQNRMEGKAKRKFFCSCSNKHRTAKTHQFCKLSSSSCFFFLLRSIPEKKNAFTMNVSQSIEFHVANSLLFLAYFRIIIHSSRPYDSKNE